MKGDGDMFKVGDKVKIESKFHGMYNGLNGTVIENDKDKWYVRVRFDVPLIKEGYDRKIEEEIFYPSELNLATQ